MQFEAILFDLDGTLVDSEPLHVRAWEIVFEERGIVQSSDWFYDWVGVVDKKVAAHLQKNLPPGTDTRGILQAKRDAFAALAPHALKPFDGLAEYILGLNGVPLAVTTSSARRDLDLTLKSIGLAGAFKTTVSADDVTRHKPNPEPYLLTCAQLNVAPESCVAIEDSPTGTASAHAAGCLVLGVTTTHEASKLPLAHQIFGSTLDALRHISDVSGTPLRSL